MSYGQSYRQPYQPPLPPAKKRRGCVFGCLVTLTVGVFALLALVLVVVFYLKPRLSQEFGNVVAGQLNEQLEQKVNEQIGGATGQIPGDFSGQVVIPEAEVNAYIAANPQQIAPLDSASVRFVPDEMQATVQAYGASGTAFAGVTVVDGQVVVTNPRIEGVLSFFIDANQLAGALQTQLNSQLATNNQRITTIQIEEGQIVAEITNN